MASIPMNTETIQMSTPLQNLPLKTSGENNSITDDPSVNTVLKEFEKYKQPEEEPIIQDPIYEMPQIIEQQYVSQQPNDDFNHLKYNSSPNSSSSIFDFEIAKSSIIVVLIVALIFNTTILEKIISQLPENFKMRIIGKEAYILLFLLFIIIYAKEKYLSL